MSPRSQASIALSLALSLLAASPVGSADPPTITFFVASDSHFGARGMNELNREVVKQMNELPGTEYPPELGGSVDQPRGVLFTGDTTDNGHLDEFAQFEEVYGLTGKDGLLRFPVFEAIGNHDVNRDSPIKERVKRRHGAIHYSWDWSDLHFVCLDMYPDATTLRWLGADLRRVPPGRPVIPFFHYSLEGYYSDFWPSADKEAFAKALEPYNVPAIFHGHEHHVGHYVWKGHAIFRPGAPRHSSHAFLVVRVTARAMAVAAWDFDNRRWLHSWVMPIRRS
jgi:cytolysin (calcineurin-like family phosphatase)